MNKWPCHFTWRKSLPLYKQALEPLADFMGTKTKNLVFIANTTTGLNSVLKSLNLRPGSAIMGTSLTYGAVQYAIQETVRIKPGLKSLFMDIIFPIHSKQDLIDRFTSYLDEHPNIKLAVIDHITSPSAVLMPIQELVALFHSREIFVAVDGAHAAGQVQVNLDELDADFYTSSMHKWLFAPRGCGFLYISPRHQGNVHPAITSWDYAGSDMHAEFQKEGTRDQTPYFSVPAAIRFYQEIGGWETVRNYCRPLADDVVDLLVKAWHTEKLPIPRELEAPCLRLVRVPFIEGYHRADVSISRCLHNEFMPTIFISLYYKVNEYILIHLNVVLDPISSKLGRLCRVLAQNDARWDYLYMQLGDTSLLMDKTESDLKLQEHIFFEYKLQLIMISCQGKSYVRVATPAYTDHRDFEEMARIVLEIQAKANVCRSNAST
ncbi:PREDICTED: isopenicillin N epimerase-like isoform X2 [Priapulus caudatus]|nr:PREDICTED: isopenicillin N epimerase-like isoform X2 [Priapulus caudatus]